MQKIVPHLWFNGAAEDAARLYTALIPGSRLGAVMRYGKAGVEIHGQPEGAVMTVEFALGGYRLVGLNGGPLFRPTPAVSYFVTLESGPQVDRAWDGLAEGGSVVMPLDAYDWSPRYGWLSDGHGVSWQIALGKRANVGAMAAPSLLFCGLQAGRAEGALAHYVSICPGSRVDGIMRHDGAGAEAADTVMHARFRLGGRTFMAMDSARLHDFGFTEVNVFLVACETQNEIDRFWTAPAADPEAGQCGWLKDRFGLSWEIEPRALLGMLSDPDRGAADRDMAALLEMRKIDIAEL